MYRTYFPKITADQINLLLKLEEHYVEWNQKINVISRKDIDQVAVNHILHGLFIAKFIRFKHNTKVLDVGTGGGIPGLPLAILFPESHFTLVDSVRKKLKVIDDFVLRNDLKNIETQHKRVEDIKGEYEFIVSRAVAPAKKIIEWTRNKLKPGYDQELENGWLFLKGGALTNELRETKKAYQQFSLKNHCELPYYDQKYLIHMPF